jgi:hypothetical protein
MTKTPTATPKAKTEKKLSNLSKKNLELVVGGQGIIVDEHGK